MQGTAKSFLISALVLLPSAFLTFWLVGQHKPVPYVYLAACAVLLLAAADFALIILIEPYRKDLGRLTIPALLGMICVTLLFMISAALNRFFPHLGYGFLAIPAALALLAVYIAAFVEKKTLLKACLGVNAAALSLMWAMAATDKFTLPF